MDTNEIIELEERMLRADIDSDAGFFDEFCADDFVAVSSYGVYAKKQVLEMYEQGSADPDRRSEIKDARVLSVGAEGAAVTYTLVSGTSAESTSNYATTVYRRSPDGWRLVLLQHTRI